MTEKQKRDAGFLYDANNDKEIISELTACADKCYDYNNLCPSDSANMEKLIREIMGSVGKNPIIAQPMWIDYGYKTTLGDYFYSNHNIVILDGGGVTFGDHVFVAPNCTFTTAEHAIDAQQRNAGLEVALPIKVGNNVWFGAGCIVLGGVTIGDNTIIGAGSVVTKDIPSGVIAVGTPCRALRKITEEDKHRYPTAL